MTTSTVNRETLQNQAIQAAQAAIAAHYDTARAELAAEGLFGKELDRKARKLAFKMGGFTLPEGWTIAMVTPLGWGQGGTRPTLHARKATKHRTKNRAFCYRLGFGCYFGLFVCGVHGMSTDKELLELAAKAIGLKLRYNYLGGRDANQPWNPLTDDGDALRLAVKLNLIDERQWKAPITGAIYDECNGDWYAATRRAIVRAAAEIGKTL